MELTPLRTSAPTRSKENDVLDLRVRGETGGEVGDEGVAGEVCNTGDLCVEEERGGGNESEREVVMVNLFPWMGLEPGTEDVRERDGGSRGTDGVLGNVSVLGLSLVTVVVLIVVAVVVIAMGEARLGAEEVDDVVG
jgi:hypothetical protein